MHAEHSCMHFPGRRACMLDAGAHKQGTAACTSRAGVHAGVHACSTQAHTSRAQLHALPGQACMRAHAFEATECIHGQFRCMDACVRVNGCMKNTVLGAVRLACFHTPNMSALLVPKEDLSFSHSASPDMYIALDPAASHGHLAHNLSSTQMPC
eukprot:91784-Chlamydomonas_euryale.AAC.5